MRVVQVLFKVVASLVAISVVGVVGVVAATWAPDKPVSALTGKWAPAPSKFVAVDGMNVHLRDEGPRDDPSPVVLLHGTSASLHTFQGWADALKGQRRVIRLDLPGFGLTGPFPDDDYAMEHYVGFLEHFLAALHVQHAVLIGNSFGGNLAWHAALALPDRVAKLVLVDASGHAYQRTSTPIGFRLARYPWLGVLLDRVLPRSVVASSVRNVYADPSRVTPALIDRYYDLTLRAGNRHALARRFAQVIPGQDARRIAELQLPTLILWGREDRLNTLDGAERFQRAIANSQLVILDRLAHVPHEEDPARSVVPVKAFLGLH